MPVTNLPAFKAEIANYTVKVRRVSGVARNALAVNVLGAVVEPWPVDTGFSRAQWHIAPEPATDIPTGAVASLPNVFPDDPYAPVYVANGANYAQFIEYGTRYVAPKLLLAQAVQATEAQAETIFAQVAAEEGL